MTLSSQSQTPQRPTLEDLATRLQMLREEVAACLVQGHDERALTILGETCRLKLQLYEELKRDIEAEARRLGDYTNRTTGRSADDLLGESWAKYSVAIGRWKPGGASVRTFIRLVMNRYFLQLGRVPRPWPCDFGSEAESAPTAVSPSQLMEFNDLLDRVIPNDPARTIKVAVFRRYWLERWTIPELASQEGVAASSIHRWLKSVQAAVKAAWATS